MGSSCCEADTEPFVRMFSFCFPSRDRLKRPKMLKVITSKFLHSYFPKTTSLSSSNKGSYNFFLLKDDYSLEKDESWTFCRNLDSPKVPINYSTFDIFLYSCSPFSITSGFSFSSMVIFETFFICEKVPKWSFVIFAQSTKFPW